MSEGLKGPEAPEGPEGLVPNAPNARSARSAPASSDLHDLDLDLDVQLWDSNSVLGQVSNFNSFNSFNSSVRNVNPVGQTFPKCQIPLLPLFLKFARSASITCHLCLSMRGADTKVLDSSMSYSLF